MSLCLASVTDRNDRHIESRCLFKKGHAGAHFDMRTMTHWTDETTWYEPADKAES